MMKADFFLLLGGMFLVTYLPRLLPLLAIKPAHLNPFIKRFLSLIPVTALGALLFPGLILDSADFPIAGLTGILLCALYSWLRGGIVVPVFIAVAVTFLLRLIGF
jgi:branched-subunit amino acid transport protein